MKQYGEWQGTIGKTLADSQPWFPEPPHPGDDAPNVVIVLLDDLGFAQLGCYGSDIDTPNIDINVQPPAIRRGLGHSTRRTQPPIVK